MYEEKNIRYSSTNIITRKFEIISNFTIYERKRNEK